jgi:hypothetical protein
LQQKPFFLLTHHSELHWRIPTEGISFFVDRSDLSDIQQGVADTITIGFMEEFFFVF